MLQNVASIVAIGLQMVNKRRIIHYTPFLTSTARNQDNKIKYAYSWLFQFVLLNFKSRRLKFIV
jgi:hypothetical protein